MVATKEQKPSFLTTVGMEHEVNGETLTFYPLSIKALFSLRVIGKPLAQAVAALFSGVGRENGHQERVVAKGDDYETETTIAPIDPKLAQVKIDDRNKAIEGLIDAFTKESNLSTLLGVIENSIRGKVSAKDLESTDVKILSQMCEGVYKANEETFRPLVGRLFAMRGETPGPVVEPAATPSRESVPAL